MFWGKYPESLTLPCLTKSNRVPIEHSYLKQLQHGCCVL